MEVLFSYTQEACIWPWPTHNHTLTSLGVKGLLHRFMGSLNTTMFNIFVYKFCRCEKYTLSGKIIDDFSKKINIGLILQYFSLLYCIHE